MGRSGRRRKGERGPKKRGQPRTPTEPAVPSEGVRIEVLFAGVAALLLLVFVGLGLVLARTGSDEESGGGNGPPPVARISDLQELDVAVAGAIRQAVTRVEREPWSGGAHGELGRLYHAHKYFELARRSYETAHRLDPETPDWPYYLGLLAAERGRHSEARRYFEKVLDLRPGYTPALYRLGTVLLTEERYAEAERVFSRMVDLEPANPWAHLGLGRIERRRERPEAAIRHLERALELDGGIREAAYLLAMSRRETGNDEGAARLLDDLPAPAEARLEDPILARALRQRRDLQSRIQAANRLLAEGNPEAAEALYLSVLESQPRHYDALYNLGLLYGRSARYEEAEGMLERAVDARPKSAEAHFLLAMAYASQQKVEDARAQARAALEADPGHPRARELLRQLPGSP